MDSRTGRRPRKHDQEEPDVISPQAARLNGGVRLGPRRQGQWPASSASGSSAGAGPPLRRPIHAGRSRRGDHFEDVYDSDEGEVCRRPHVDRRHLHDAEEEAGFADTRPSARRHNNRTPRGHAEDEDGSEEDGGDLGRHHRARGDRQNHAGYSGSRNGKGPLAHNNRGAGRPRHHDAEDNSAFEAAGARPGPCNPISRVGRDHYRDREVSEDDERYGGSRRGGGDRARDRSEQYYDEPDPRASRDLVRGRKTPKDDGYSQEQEGRFVPYTFRLLHPSHVEFLVRVFKVRTSKVKEWCEENYIRMDKSKNDETNIDPLLSTLTSKDREVYEKAVQRNRNEMEIMDAVERGPSRAGRVSVRRDPTQAPAVHKQANHKRIARGPSRHESLWE